MDILAVELGRDEISGEVLVSLKNDSEPSNLWRLTTNRNNNNMIQLECKQRELFYFIVLFTRALGWAEGNEVQV